MFERILMTNAVYQLDIDFWNSSSQNPSILKSEDAPDPSFWNWLQLDDHIERDLLAGESVGIRCAQVTLRSLRMSSHAYSLLCLGALIADHFLAIRHPTRHRQWVSSRVVSALLAALVGISLLVRFHCYLFEECN